MSKHIKYFLIVLVVFGCSNSVTSPEPEEDPLFEIKHWGTIASTHRSSTHEPWNGLSGLQKAYLILNKDDVDLEIEYSLQIWGARLWSDLQTLILIEEAPFLLSTLGLLSEDITFNYDPVRIIEDFVIKPGNKAFAIAFALVDWKEWFSVWSTVRIKVFRIGLQKENIVYEFKETTEIKLPLK